MSVIGVIRLAVMVAAIVVVGWVHVAIVIAAAVVVVPMGPALVGWGGSWTGIVGVEVVVIVVLISAGVVTVVMMVMIRRSAWEGRRSWRSGRRCRRRRPACREVRARRRTFAAAFVVARMATGTVTTSIS